LPGSRTTWMAGTSQDEAGHDGRSHGSTVVPR
jgi:hypothetical protein